MSKEEVYYEISFPYDNNIKTNDLQDLISNNPDKVITYNKLSERLKSYIDDYISKPKYFDIRNYEDNNVLQSGGLSLIVSHTPEVNNIATHGCTKFKSKHDGKIVYCSIVVSSGNFYYNWNLPEDALEKSGLRDIIVGSRFHSNWYFTQDERNDYSKNVGVNLEVGNEKYVFNPQWFTERTEPTAISLPYGHRAGINYFVNYTDSNNNVYQQTEVIYTEPDDKGFLISYKYPNVKTPDYTKGGKFYLDSNSNIEVFRHRYELNQVKQESDKYFTISDHKEVSPRYAPEQYNDIHEDLKKDFIDLEVTRRILYNYSDIATNISDIPIILRGTGKSTVLSYEPPKEYITRTPLPITYNLLRNVLNNKDPYSDCETVLVMWVADKDPATINKSSDVNININNLRNLHWEQYAIPVSLRCRLKNGTYNTERFLISYPHEEGNYSNFQFHIRRNNQYSKSQFKDILYLPGLIEYSNDYIITMQNLNCTGNKFSDVFDIQKFLLQNYISQFKNLYVRRSYTVIEGNQQQQSFYLQVKRDLYKINTSSANICFRDSISSDSVFIPNNKVLYSSYGLTEEDLSDIRTGTWRIDNNLFIAMFGLQNITTVQGTLQIVGSKTLYDNLCSKIPSYNFKDIYISSLGITCTPYNWDIIDSTKFGLTGIWLPLGLLDNHIKIGNTIYGRNYGKVIVGLKNVFDSTYSDLHHLRYNEKNNTYEFVNDTNKSLIYSAYVSKYI